jgi:hypothetical protein
VEKEDEERIEEQEKRVKKGQKHRNEVTRESKCKKGERDGIKETSAQRKKFLTQQRT